MHLMCDHGQRWGKTLPKSWFSDFAVITSRMHVRFLAFVVTVLKLSLKTQDHKSQTNTHIRYHNQKLVN